MFQPTCTRTPTLPPTLLMRLLPSYLVASLFPRRKSLRIARERGKGKGNKEASRQYSARDISQKATKILPSLELEEKKNKEKKKTTRLFRENIMNSVFGSRVLNLFAPFGLRADLSISPSPSHDLLPHKSQIEMERGCACVWVFLSLGPDPQPKNSGIKLHRLLQDPNN